VSIKRRSNDRNRLSPRRETTTPLSLPNQLLWAAIGLMLTIFGTFIEAFATNFPWEWAEKGIYSQSLGITCQLGAVLLTGCMGGRNAGVLSQIAYIILGLFWLPIFAHGGGLGYFREPSFGYLLGFIPGAGLCGAIALRYRTRLETLAYSAFCGLLVIHLCGLIYLIALSGLGLANDSVISLANLGENISNYSIAPIPGQLVMVCVVAAIAFFLRHLLFY
jgi:biotin transport system substrate-specific component